MPVVDFEDLFRQADRLRNDAKVDEAIKAYRDIVELAIENHEALYKGRALHMAGVAAKESVAGRESAYYRDALNFFGSAEEVYRSLGDQKLLGALYRDIAILSNYANDSMTALMYFQKALATLEPTDFFGELAITYDKLGAHFYRLGQFDQAQGFIDKALLTFKKEPTAGFYRATCLLDSARNQFRMGKYTEARDLAEESLSWFKADHPGMSYGRRIAQLYGLLALVGRQLDQEKDFDRYYRDYQKELKTFDPLAAKVIEAELELLAS